MTMIRAAALAAFVVLGSAAAAAAAAPAPAPTPNPPARPTAADLFARLDQDADGFVRAEDIKALRIQGFDRADANADGFVDAAERANLRDVAEGMGGGRGLGPRQGGEGAGAPSVDRFDLDADGLISRAEWTDREIAILRLDADGDGAVSQSEFQAIQGRRRTP